VAARLVGRLGPSFARRGRHLGTVVVGAAPGDPHALPVAMLADIVRAHGYRVVDLGANVPVESFTAAAAGDRVVAVGVSISDTGCLPAAGAAVAAVRAVTSVPILVGGPATDASVAVPGADGWAGDGAAAAQLIDELRPSAY
jgi:5-methyltetrahydrofolate--homocysteine methyltransferase